MQAHYYKFWRDLIKPKGFEVDKDSFREDYGKFTIRPLEKGYGVTIGNSLRRILLSSMMGASVTAVKFDGVLHEFSSLPDVLEDVSDIILNLKEIRFKMYTSENVTLRINKSGPAKITAADIQTNEKVEILNQNAHIATIGPNGNFNVEIIVGFGRGYVPADMKEESFPVGFIPVDSLFSPIKKVNYSVLSARVGQRTDYDSLVIEVWTDGSIKPDEALSLSSKIMKDQLQVFLIFDESFEPKEDKS
ncbi:MAG: DNA-directed RNA polymerase subunit alpha, partial [Bdellovibrionales bacterium]|nr:DNA-directed RNA polymerase subunit alpha [Bdellovibrionales bacterium]